MKNGKVIIIGSSNSIYEVKAGDFIDTCDIVIRLNDTYFFKKPKTNFGQKIDIFSVGFNKHIHKIDEFNNFVNAKNTKLWWYADKVKLQNGIYKFPHETYEKMYEECKKSFLSVEPLVEGRNIIQANKISIPSTGILSVVKAINYFKNKEIYIVGFGSENCKKSSMGVHDVQKEDKLLELFEYKKKIKRLEYIL